MVTKGWCTFWRLDIVYKTSCSDHISWALSIKKTFSYFIKNLRLQQKVRWSDEMNKIEVTLELDSFPSLHRPILLWHVYKVNPPCIQKGLSVNPFYIRFSNLVPCHAIGIPISGIIFIQCLQCYTSSYKIIIK